MINPSFEEFRKLAQQGNLVALRYEIPSDLETPVSTFLKLERNQPFAFLLESAEQQEQIGRYSILGFHPESVWGVRGDHAFIEKNGRSRTLGGRECLFSSMRAEMSKFKLTNPETVPGFAGGFVGFVGYEMVSNFEKIKLSPKPGLGIEESLFFLMHEFLLFDHFRKSLSFISLCEISSKRTAHLKKLYQSETVRFKKIEASLSAGLHAPKKGAGVQLKTGVRSNVSRTVFESRVKKIQEYIRAGDCIQVVFSQRFDLGPVKDDFHVYRALRSLNPSPYMFYFRYKDLRLVGSSPEVLVKKAGRRAEMRPIAGTRRRGETLREDMRQEENLRDSKKEKAEHLMLVDLGRNDLGRVCEFKSIQVGEFARVERYSHVMHLVSDVVGKLKAGKDAFDLLRAVFPAGTVTGAPKVRAMEIINELENEGRGPYAGCLGYFSFNQDMDMCIMIRTIVVKNSRAYVQAGAGVVYDSQPSREFEETLNKARALLDAAKQGRGR